MVLLLASCKQRINGMVVVPLARLSFFLYHFFVLRALMCSEHKLSHQQLIKKSRHRYEWLLFAVAAFLTVTAFIVALSLSVFKAETVDFFKDGEH